MFLVYELCSNSNSSAKTKSFSLFQPPVHAGIRLFQRPDVRTEARVRTPAAVSRARTSNPCPCSHKKIACPLLRLGFTCPCGPTPPAPHDRAGTARVSSASHALCNMYNTRSTFETSRCSTCNIYPKTNETLAKIHEKHLKTITNILNIHMKHLQHICETYATSR
jgi:hypothetical protein